MKKPCSEIGLWVSRVGARYLSQSMFFSYLYEKKMSNMHIENFKKSETFYKKIINHLFWDISKCFFLSGPNVKKTKLRRSIQVHLHMIRLNEAGTHFVHFGIKKSEIPGQPPPRGCTQ